MGYNWDFRFLLNYAPALLRGLWVTLYVSLVSILGGSILGVALAIARKSHFLVLRIVSAVYINIFLAFPVLVLLIWLYYCLPVITGFSISSDWTAILALTLSLGGFIGDILRGGIDSIPKEQEESALTLGLSKWQAMHRIILPQAIKVMIPPVLGQYITCIKLSSLASVIAVYELVHSAENIISKTYKPLETYTAVAILYLAIILPMILMMRKFESRVVGPINKNRDIIILQKFVQWFRSA